VRVLTSTLIALLMLAAPGQAQTRGADGIPGEPPPRDPPPRFSVARQAGALAPIGLPLPRIGLQPPASRAESGRRFRHGAFTFWPMMVFYAPQPFLAPPPPEPAPRPVERVPAQGRLILDLDPATAQVFADGYYVGLPDDFSAARGGGLLEAGPHRIDVSAAGYEPMTLDIMVTAGQRVTVRAPLKVHPPPTIVPPTTFYLIPGCYMGNIPPKDARLPATCDQSRTIVWLP
jgi:hypothetical protein